MAVFALLPDHKPQFLDSAGDPASGAQLFVYTAGSSTKATSYTESDGLIANANPVVLDSRGEPGSGVYVASGTYKMILAPAGDTDPPASPIWTRDNISPINDTTTTQSEWVTSALTPTYIGATQFSVVGDQTSLFTVGRRIKAVVSAGTVYGVITVSAFSSVTTVTVTTDSGALDAGLSEVSYSLLSSANSSIPHIKSAASGLTVTGNLTLGGTFVTTAAAGTVFESDGAAATFGARRKIQAAVSTTSGTSVDITGIPSWATRVVVYFRAVSGNGTAAWAVQLGDAGGIETAGYTSAASTTGASTVVSTGSTGGWILFGGPSIAASAYTGRAVIELVDVANFGWSFESSLGDGVNVTAKGVGYKQTSAAMTTIRLNAGGDTLDGGSIVAVWE